MSNRLPGVVNSTSNGPDEFGAPKTVESIVKMEQYLVKFFDADGKAHVDVLIRIGDDYFANQNGEAWANNLGKVQKWLGETVGRRIAAKERGGAVASVPEKDAVNPMAARIQQETSNIVGRGQ